MSTDEDLDSARGLAAAILRTELCRISAEFGDTHVDRAPEADYTTLIRVDVLEPGSGPFGVTSGFYAPPPIRPYAPTVRWHGGGMTIYLTLDSRDQREPAPPQEMLDQALVEYRRFVRHQHQARAELAMELVEAVETAIGYWHRFIDALPMSDDEQRIGGALIAALSELIKVDEPPRAQIRSALEWFGQRVAEKTADTIGVLVGTGIAATGAYAVARATGTWDEFGVYIKHALGLT